MSTLPPIAEEEGSIQIGGPRVPADMRKWRGAAKGSHSKAVTAAGSGILLHYDRDTLLGMRADIVKRYEDVTARHDWLLAHTTLSPQEQLTETGWLQEVTRVHYEGINAIDTYLRSLPVPKSKSSSRHSQASSRSMSSSQARLIEAERAEREAELKLRQVNEENERQAREDEALAQRKIEQQRNALQLEAEERRVQAERLKRSAEADLERQRLNSEVLRQDLGGDFDDEEDKVNTPLPTLDQMKSMYEEKNLDSSQEGAVAQPQTLKKDDIISLSQTSIASSGRRFGPIAKLGQMFRNTIGALTPRRAPPPVTSFVNRLPAAQNGPAVPQRFGHDPVMPTSLRSSTPMPPSLNAPVPPVCSQSTVQQLLPSVQTMAGFSNPNQDLGARPKATTSSQPLPKVAPELPRASVTFAPPVGMVHHPSRRQDIGDPAWSSTPFQPEAAGQPIFTGRQNVPEQNTGWSNHMFGGPTAQGPHQSNPYSADEWISSIGLNMMASSSARSNIKPPRMELPKFDGSPRQYPLFIQSFKIQVHDVCDNDAVRLAHLRNCLSPEIQSHLGEALVNPGLYQFALLELQRKFGNPQIVAQACTTALLALKPFKDNDYAALRLFASTLHSVVATLNYSGYGVELYSSATLYQLVSKLPPLLKSKWGEVSWSWQPNLPTVVDFDCWLDNVSMAEYALRAGVPVQEQQSDKPNKNGRKPVAQAAKTNFSGSSTTLPDKAGFCANCEGKHQISFCHKFKTMSVNDRSDVVLKKRLCYRCLNKGHFGADCKKKDRCKVDGCKSKHHPLMHGAPKLFPATQGQPTDKETDTKTPSSGADKDKGSEHESNEKRKFSGSTSYSSANSGTLLPIVPVEVRYANQAIKTFALLDIGSQVTMVKNWLATDLNMKRGAPVNTGFGTVGGATPSKPRDTVDFTLASLEGDVVFDIDKALIVDSFHLSQRPVNIQRNDRTCLACR